jgi:hypothetical protein
MSSYVGFSNGICGVAPGASFDELLCSVSDPSSKELFRMMFLNQQGMHASLVAHSASNQAIVSLLSSIDTKVQQTHDEVTSLKACSVFQSPFPMVVHAESRTNSTLSSNDTALSGESHDEDGLLHCPFCPSKHNNEKSHVQHMRRIVQRCVPCFVCDLCVSVVL